MEKEDILFINKAYDVCTERGKLYEFECPICKGKAQAIKDNYNGHLHAECKQCDLLIMQ